MYVVMNIYGTEVNFPGCKTKTNKYISYIVRGSSALWENAPIKKNKSQTNINDGASVQVVQVHSTIRKCINAFAVKTNCLFMMNISIGHI